MKVAAIDCGTNALRLLVLQQGEDGTVVELTRQLRLVRLGEGVDRTGQFAPAALARMMTALSDYAAELDRWGVTRVRFVATSAARDVTNANEFRTRVEHCLHVPAEIITGAEEAAWTFTGAVAGVPTATPPVLVTDIGGGSTELVEGGKSIDRAVSLNIGSVRLRERFLSADPPTPDQLVAATTQIDADLDSVDLSGVGTWIGVAGTVTSMGALRLGLTDYDRAAVHGLTLTKAEIHAISQRLNTTAAADLVSRALPRLRAEVIAGGALICARIAARVTSPMTISENDLLDGVAHGLLD